MRVLDRIENKENDELLGNATFRPQKNSVNIFTERNKMGGNSKKNLRDLINGFSEKEGQLKEERNKPKEAKCCVRISSLVDKNSKTKYEALL